MEIACLCDGNFHNAAFFIARQFLGSLNILAYSNTNIGQRFFLGLTLRPAAGLAGAGDTVPFFGLAKNAPIVSHGSNGTPLLNQPATAL